MIYGPDNFWKLGRYLRYNDPVGPDDKLFVDTSAVRGDQVFRGLFTQLGIDEDLRLLDPTDESYLLFSGHIGSGKSTELKWLAKQLDDPDRYFVVFADLLEDLDPSYLDYADILLALAKRLCLTLSDHGIPIDQVFLRNLAAWFDQAIISQTTEKGLSTDIRAGIEGGLGLPWLGKVFGNFTNIFKYNSIYKEEVRKLVRRSYNQFAEAFNLLITAANEAIAQKGTPSRRLLFIVDGADRQDMDNTGRLFGDDFHQLQMIRANFIYCAPIHIQYVHSKVQQRPNLVFRLPMIKLHERDQPDQPLPQAYAVLREMVFRRVHPDLFDDPRPVEDMGHVVNYLIRHSGGHPRHLVRLIDFARMNARHERFDQRAAEKAVADLALEYQYFLNPEDYRILAQVDTQPDLEITDRSRFLLEHLAILEYNSVWRRSHPVIQTLRQYQSAVRGA